ncbi:tetratricopeptide repeat protein [Roseospirillum parvum]|nr:tetratricopeptide repeat protein [Roseospirillum parvum]
MGLAILLLAAPALAQESSSGGAPPEPADGSSASDRGDSGAAPADGATPDPADGPSPAEAPAADDTPRPAGAPADAVRPDDAEQARREAAFAAMLEQADKRKALEAEARKAGAGGMYRLARRYEDGEGVTANDTLAWSWYQRAADSGHVEAMVRVAEFFETGRGVPQSFNDAYTWFEKAAEKGHPVAMGKTGELLLEGRGVTRDISAAESWLRKAVVAGDSEAQFIVAELVDKGVMEPVPLPGETDPEDPKARRVLALVRHVAGLPPLPPRPEEMARPGPNGAGGTGRDGDPAQGEADDPTLGMIPIAPGQYTFELGEPMRILALEPESDSGFSFSRDLLEPLDPALYAVAGGGKTEDGKAEDGKAVPLDRRPAWLVYLPRARLWLPEGEVSLRLGTILLRVVDLGQGRWLMEPRIPTRFEIHHAESNLGVVVRWASDAVRLVWSEDLGTFSAADYLLDGLQMDVLDGAVAFSISHVEGGGAVLPRAGGKPDDPLGVLYDYQEDFEMSGLRLRFRDSLANPDSTPSVEMVLGRITSESRARGMALGRLVDLARELGIDLYRQEYNPERLLARLGEPISLPLMAESGMADFVLHDLSVDDHRKDMHFHLGRLGSKVTYLSARAPDAAELAEPTPLPAETDQPMNLEQLPQQAPEAVGQTDEPAPLDPGQSRFGMGFEMTGLVLPEPGEEVDPEERRTWENALALAPDRVAVELGFDRVPEEALVNGMVEEMRQLGVDLSGLDPAQDPVAAAELERRVLEAFGNLVEAAMTSPVRLDVREVAYLNDLFGLSVSGEVEPVLTDPESSPAPTPPDDGPMAMGPELDMLGLDGAAARGYLTLRVRGFEALIAAAIKTAGPMAGMMLGMPPAMGQMPPDGSAQVEADIAQQAALLELVGRLRDLAEIDSDPQGREVLIYTFAFGPEHQPVINGRLMEEVVEMLTPPQATLQEQ